MTTIAIAPKPTISAVELRPPSTQANAENRLKAALEHARRLTKMYGYEQVEVAIAWETVEELQAAQAPQPESTCHAAFDRYCAANPHARECRSYEC